MPTQIRSGALNLFRKNSFAEQKADVLKMMANADVLSLSEVHGVELLRWAKQQGFGVIMSKDDTAIIYDASRFEVLDKGSETLNQTEGPTGGMRSREAAWGLLRDKNTGEKFFQISAHTTPPRQGPKRLRQKIRKEQYRSLSQLGERLQGKSRDFQDKGKIPVLLAGDLNFRNPNVVGFNRATNGGIMHTLALGAGAKEVERLRRLNSDHAGVVTTYKPGKKSGNMRPNQKIRPAGGGDPLTAEELREEYGYGYRFFRSDPDLWNLLKQGIENGWTQDQMVAHLKETQWFRSHRESWRKGMEMKFTDPATYKERVGNFRTQIENLAGTWGIKLTGKQVNRYAERAYLLNWSPEQALDHLAKDIKPGKDGGYDGQLAGIQDQLMSTALRNGVRIGKDQMQGWMKAITKGNADAKEYEGYIRRMAAQTYTAYAKELKAGVDLADIAAPYIQSMADILELNPREVDVFDRSLRKAMTYRNEKGEATPMSISDFEDSLRADNRWQYTQNARETMQGYAVTLGKMWGVL